MKTHVLYEPNGKAIFQMLPEGSQEKGIIDSLRKGEMVLGKFYPCSDAFVFEIEENKEGTSRCPICGKDTPHSHTPPPAETGLHHGQLIRLQQAFDAMRNLTYQGHAAHWDPTMEHGAGCPECKRVDEGRTVADARWEAALAARPEKET